MPAAITGVKLYGCGINLDKVIIKIKLTGKKECFITFLNLYIEY